MQLPIGVGEAMVEVELGAEPAATRFQADGLKQVGSAGQQVGLVEKSQQSFFCEDGRGLAKLKLLREPGVQ